MDVILVNKLNVKCCLLQLYGNIYSAARGNIKVILIAVLGKRFLRVLAVVSGDNLIVLGQIRLDINPVADVGCHISVIILEEFVAVCIHQLKRTAGFRLLALYDVVDQFLQLGVVFEKDGTVICITHSGNRSGFGLYFPRSQRKRINNHIARQGRCLVHFRRIIREKHAVVRRMDGLFYHDIGRRIVTNPVKVDSDIGGFDILRRNLRSSIQTNIFHRMDKVDSVCFWINDLTFNQFCRNISVYLNDNISSHVAKRNAC